MTRDIDNIVEDDNNELDGRCITVESDMSSNQVDGYEKSASQAKQIVYHDSHLYLDRRTCYSHSSGPSQDRRMLHYGGRQWTKSLAGDAHQ